jgi:hypothetical protein
MYKEHNGLVWMFSASLNVTLNFNWVHSEVTPEDDTVVSKDTLCQVFLKYKYFKLFYDTSHFGQLL